MSDQPNILWICTDQQRWDTLGCTGNEWIRTPNLDRLAADGVCCTHAFCQSPVCQPSRGSFLTGRYPMTTRLRQNGQPMSGDERLITRTLADNGYVCGLAGKLHLRPVDRRLSLPNCGRDAHESLWVRGAEERMLDGYSEFNWEHDGRGSHPASAYTAWLHDRKLTFPDKELFEFPHVHVGYEEEDHCSTWATDRAISFIERHAAAAYPWLFSVNFIDPHHPFNPPAADLQRWLDRLDELPLPAYQDGELDEKPELHRIFSRQAYNEPWFGVDFEAISDDGHRLARAAYWAMIELIDRQVGRVLSTLEETGQAANTLVIFTSDHGELLGDHGIYFKGPFCYDAAVRVPLLFRWPARISPKQRCDELVELVDLAPTILDACGLPRDPAMQGKSLLPLLSGAREQHRNDVFCQYHNAMPSHDEGASYVDMIRTKTHKLVLTHGHGGELYDLDVDSGEHVNRWDDPSLTGIRTELLQRLCERLTYCADPEPQRTGMF